MRTLLYIPTIHTDADLGSMAKEVTRRGIAGLGNEIWAEHKKTVEGFWDALSDYLDSLNVKGMKIYQDGLVATGDIGEKVVDEAAKAGSRNYQLVSTLLQRGALLTKTEDVSLAKREYNNLLALMQARSTVGKIVAFIRYRLAKRRLLNKRDKFIAKTIDQTLEPNETAILFVGAAHEIKIRLPKDIRTREVKDIQKVRNYQTLLPFHDRYSERFAELSRYLVSEIGSADNSSNHT